MKITNLKELTGGKYKKIMDRSGGTNPTILPTVRQTMESVRIGGDEVIIRKYKSRCRSYLALLVTCDEISNAYKEVKKDTLLALEQMIRNIRKVHEAQLPSIVDPTVSPEKGIKVWREWRAIDRVGLYIPGGKAIYPSSVLMSAIPAIIAGCGEIVMCSPPNEQGEIPAVTLVAANMVGLKRIYKVGGIEAIASMTYGTESIPKVYKIFGAGNSYVTAAKMIALETISIDMPAGPSEVLIIADNTANPKYIAADLLADAEHGEDSACILLTTSEKVAKETIREIDKQMKRLVTKGRATKSLESYGLIAFVEHLDEAIDFTNKYAPEHLEIMTKDYLSVAGKIRNAGSVFLGSYTSKSSGDYATGANHVLPTGGMAKKYPPLGVDAYGKWMQLQECTKGGLSKIRKSIEIIACDENLPAHKESTAVRFTNY